MASLTSSSRRLRCRISSLMASTSPSPYLYTSDFLSPSTFTIQRHLTAFASPPRLTPQSTASIQYWASNSKLNGEYTEEEVNKWQQTFDNLKIYDKQDLTKWRQGFDATDTDHDGLISQADLQKNPNFTVSKLNLFKAYDYDHNNMIDFGEFVDAMFNVDIEGMRCSFEGFDQEDIKMEFDKFAVSNESTPTGIDVEGMKRFMSAHDFAVITDVDALRLIQLIDFDQDGVVGQDDLKKWLTNKGN
eukprot:GHVN01102686.1.p1 GENE.GHVN01102686.1~~GHVN01102686.1.p1  ORF type:complete len:245 (+),score=58.81 GHVN01102686.1:55-789(+)